MSDHATARAALYAATTRFLQTIRRLEVPRTADELVDENVAIARADLLHSATGVDPALEPMDLASDRGPYASETVLLFQSLRSALGNRPSPTSDLSSPTFAVPDAVGAFLLFATPADTLGTPLEDPIPLDHWNLAQFRVAQDVGVLLGSHFGVHELASRVINTIRGFESATRLLPVLFQVCSLQHDLLRHRTPQTLPSAALTADEWRDWAQAVTDRNSLMREVQDLRRQANDWRVECYAVARERTKLAESNRVLAAGRTEVQVRSLRAESLIAQLRAEKIELERQATPAARQRELLNFGQHLRSCISVLHFDPAAWEQLVVDYMSGNATMRAHIVLNLSTLPAVSGQSPASVSATPSVPVQPLPQASGSRPAARPRHVYASGSETDEDLTIRKRLRVEADDEEEEKDDPVQSTPNSKASTVAPASTLGSSSKRSAKKPRRTPAASSSDGAVDLTHSPPTRPRTAPATPAPPTPQSSFLRPSPAPRPTAPPTPAVPALPVVSAPVARVLTGFAVDNVHQRPGGYVDHIPPRDPAYAAIYPGDPSAPTPHGRQGCAAWPLAKDRGWFEVRWNLEIPVDLSRYRAGTFLDPFQANELVLAGHYPLGPNNRNIPRALPLKLPQNHSVPAVASYGANSHRFFDDMVATEPWDAMWAGRAVRLYFHDPHYMDDASLHWLYIYWEFMYAYRQGFWELLHWMHMQSSKNLDSVPEWKLRQTNRELLSRAVRAGRGLLEAVRPTTFPPFYTSSLIYEPAVWCPQQATWVPPSTLQDPLDGPADAEGRLPIVRHLEELDRVEPVRFQWVRDPPRFIDALGSDAQSRAVRHHFESGRSWIAPGNWSRPDFAPFTGPTIGTPGPGFYRDPEPPNKVMLQRVIKLSKEFLQKRRPNLSLQEVAAVLFPRASRVDSAVPGILPQAAPTQATSTAHDDSDSGDSDA